VSLDEPDRGDVAREVGDAYVVSYLQLCQISYLSPKLIRSAVATTMPPLGAGGRWQCVWGPAESPDRGNLAYVAAYFDDSGALEFAAVVIRGTDVAIADVWGIIREMVEDFDVLDQVPFPWMPPGPGARVAQGTLDGLSSIAQLSAGGERLLRFLTKFLGAPGNEQAWLTVTGHSLGGCLTTVAAPWLQVTLRQSAVNNAVVPVTFAAPSAGNPAFADRYATMFAPSRRYFNSLDVVPFAWESLDGMKTIYARDGIPTPELVDLTIDLYVDLMRATGVSYAQPATAFPLEGRFADTTSDWYDEADLQHHTTTYMKLLDGTSVAAEWPHPRRMTGES
jgi:lipase (class 3)